jgi:hypothetical protein
MYKYIDDGAVQFTEKFIETSEKFIPYKEVTIRPYDKPWYDSKIRLYPDKNQ